MIFEIFKISLISFIFVKLGDPEMIFSFYQKKIANLPDWLYKPIGGCEKCFGGQVCFWYYLIVHFKDYNVIDHLFYPACGIFFVTIYTLIYDFKET
jgi:hypothetical protein